MSHPRRRLPIGAEVQPDGGTHFRVWAPAPQEVSLSVEGTDGGDVALEREPGGYYSARVPGVEAGTRYRYRLDGRLFADPVSRFQPDGPFGPSEVVDPTGYRWTDAGWRGVTLEGQVLYEMHIGTFTPEGTWRSAMGRLPHLVDTGHGVGLAGRSIRGRMAQGASPRQGRRAQMRRRLCRASERRGYRYAQRSLRRRRTVHPARMHRPGLERGGGASKLDRY